MVLSVRANRSIRKMRGGAHARLLETDEGFYVVKFLNNPQGGRRILTNEFISSLLLKAIRVATPNIARVTVPKAIAGDSDTPIVGSGSERAHLVHFGSLYPGVPGTHSIFDFFPSELLSQVLNLEDFWGALVFDKWVSNKDPRQAIFYRARLISEDKEIDGSAHWVAQMIDHGFAFQGSDWCFRDSPVQGLHGRRRVYDRATSLRSFEQWFDLLFGLTREHLQEIVSMIPIGWIAGEERALWKMLDRLMARRDQVPGLVAQSLKWLKQQSHAAARLGRG